MHTSLLVIHINNPTLWALWSFTGVLIVLILVIFYYQRAKKVTRIEMQGKVVMNIIQDEDAENILMSINCGPYEQRAPLNSIIPLEELVEEDDYTQPIYDKGREFWDKVRDIHLVESDEEAFSIARQLVELGTLNEQDIPRFLALDEEGHRPDPKTYAERFGVDTVRDTSGDDEEPEPHPEADGTSSSDGRSGASGNLFGDVDAVLSAPFEI